MPPFAAGFCRALAFCTRLPAPKTAWENAPPLSADSGYFPLAACVPAACAACVLAACALFALPAFAGALLAVLTMTMLTGALHEDGLADCADGFFTQKSPTERLVIMHDSRLGAYGASALFFALALRGALLAAILQKNGAAAAAAAFIGAEAASRGYALYLWRTGKPAAKTGIAAASGRPSLAVCAAGISAALIAAAALIIPALGPLAFITALFCGALCLMAFAALARRKLGGINGDCLGAAQQISLIAVLLGLALCR